MVQLYNALPSKPRPHVGARFMAAPCHSGTSLLSNLATLRRVSALIWRPGICSSLSGAAIANMMKTAGPSALAAKAPTAVRRSRGLAAMTKVRGVCWIRARSPHPRQVQPRRGCGRRQRRRSLSRARPLPPAQAQGSAAEQKELKLVGPEPKRFEVAEGQLKNIATAAFPFLMRLGSGGFASGYSVSLVPQDGKYAIATVLGRNIRETSAVSTFNRPAQPIVLYEFEGESCFYNFFYKLYCHQDRLPRSASFAALRTSHLPCLTRLPPSQPPCLQAALSAARWPPLSGGPRGRSPRPARGPCRPPSPGPGAASPTLFILFADLFVKPGILKKAKITLMRS